MILDMLGGEYLNRDIRCAAPDGRIISIGFLLGSRAEVDFLPVMLKRLTLSGSTLSPRPIDFKAAIASALEDRVWPLLAAGEIIPKIHCVLPLEQAAQAHRIMESGEHTGKILLRVDH